jgi:uncharacterized membrane protein (UPF0182 family)
MPQLKKVVLAVGDRLIYRDTFDEAIAELTGIPAPAKPASASASPPSAPAPAAPTQGSGALAGQIRHLREQAEELTRELEKLEKEAGNK